MSLTGTNTKKAREDFIKTVRAAGQKDLEKLRDVRAEQMGEVKKFKDLIPKDTIFNAEKQIHDLFTSYSKQLNDTINNKVKQVEKMT